MKKTKLLLACSILLFLSSCARRYTIATNTYADMTVIPQGFPLETRFAISPEESDNPMLTKEVANKITMMLQENGYCVTDKEHADYLLSFHYGMTSEMHKIEVPTFLPGPSETTCSHICMGGESLTIHEERNSPDYLVYTPEWVTLFTQCLQIEVYQPIRNSSSEKRELIWQGSSHSTDSNSDLRDGMNYLLVSAFRFFGQNTNKHLNLILDEKNPTVRWLQGEPINTQHKN